MLSLIVATSENNVIGKGNKIPWRMPRDQKYFAAVTKGHTVIMGRNTYESIMGSLGKPLPERVNIVVTRNPDFKAAGCTVVHSLEEVLKVVRLLPPLLAKEGLGVVTTPPSAPLLRNGGEEEIFVIGGSQLYAEALPKADKVYRTLIHTTLDGDAFFPTLPASDWQLTTSKLEPKDDKNPFDATYEIYERIVSNANIRIDANETNGEKIIHKELSYKITGLLFEVHNALGRFCREKQYGDAFEELLKKEKVVYAREKVQPIEIIDNKQTNRVDFVIDNAVVVELKAKEGVVKEDYRQIQRYLQASGKKLGLLVNFNSKFLHPIRIVRIDS